MQMSARWMKVAGFLILLATIGVVSCQAVFAAPGGAGF